MARVPSGHASVQGRTKQAHEGMARGATGRCGAAIRAILPMKQAESFYTNAAWRALRLAALKRDHFRCTVCGVYVGAKGDSRVDHIRPRSECPELALELSNLRVLCATCDNRRHFEKGGGQARGCGPDGWPTARAEGVAAMPKGRGLLSHPAGLRPAVVPLVIVCGAPASGKSTWVDGQRGPDDLVIDLDVIGSRMAAEMAPAGATVSTDADGHHWPRFLLERALHARNRMLDGLADAAAPWPRAWFIVCEPEARWRAWWDRTLRPERVVVMDTPMAECVRRAGRDKARIAVILRHFALYQARVGDTLVQDGEVERRLVAI